MLFFNRNFYIAKVFYNKIRVFIDVLVKNLRWKDGPNTAINIKKSNCKKVIFIIILDKYK